MHVAVSKNRSFNNYRTFWSRLLLRLTVCLITLCSTNRCQDLRDGLFSKSLVEEDCYVWVGVTFALDPVREHVRTKIQCASRCLHDEGCTRFLYCPRSPNNCIRIKMFGVFYSNPQTRNNCQCYLRNEPLPCKNGGVLRNGSCKCLRGFYGNACENVITDCADGFQRGGNILSSATNGYAYIRPSGSILPFPVQCCNKWGGYTYLMIRRGPDYAISFNRTWDEYLWGFGSIEGDYWLGLEHIHLLTAFLQFLDIVLEDGESNSIQLFYRPFKVNSKNHGFSLQTGVFTSHSPTNMTDSFASPTNQNMSGKPFITFDHNPSGSSCPNDMRCGWWFGDECTAANLNGPALTEEDYNNDPSQPRITWIGLGYIKYAHMRVTEMP